MSGEIKQLCPVCTYGERDCKRPDCVRYDQEQFERGERYFMPGGGLVGWCEKCQSTFCHCGPKTPLATKIIRQQWLNARHSHLCLAKSGTEYVVCWNNYASNLTAEEVERGIKNNGTFKSTYEAFECFKGIIKKLEEGIYFHFYCLCPKCGQLNANCKCKKVGGK